MAKYTKDFLSLVVQTIKHSSISFMAAISSALTASFLIQEEKKEVENSLMY